MSSLDRFRSMTSQPTLLKRAFQLPIPRPRGFKSARRRLAVPDGERNLGLLALLEPQQRRRDLVLAAERRRELIAPLRRVERQPRERDPGFAPRHEEQPRPCHTRSRRRRPAAARAPALAWPALRSCITSLNGSRLSSSTDRDWRPCTTREAAPRGRAGGWRDCPGRRTA